MLKLQSVVLHGLLDSSRAKSSFGGVLTWLEEMSQSKMEERHGART